jgi:hypothetical protein
MLCVANILDEPATSIFREDDNQTAQLHNLETTYAVETSDFVFCAASLIVYPFDTSLYSKRLQSSTLY